MKKILTKENVLLFIIATFFSLWLLTKGIIGGHDITFHMSRIMGLSKALSHGDIMAYIHYGVKNMGYANGIFYGNLFLYIPALLFNFIKIIPTFKIFIYIINLLTTYIMYYTSFSITKSKRTSFLATILYMGAAYRISDLTIVSAIGELLSICFIPIILLGYYKIMYEDSNKWWILSIGYFLLINAHIISSVLVTILLLIFVIIDYKKILENKKKLLYFVYAAALAFLLTSHFILPFLEGFIKNDLLFKHSLVTDLSHRSLSFIDIFMPIPRGSGKFYPGIGILIPIILLLKFKVKIEDKKLSNYVNKSIILGIISIICTTKLIPWDSIKLLSFIQFPYRFFILALPLLILPSSIILNEYLNKSKLTKYIVPTFILACTIPYLAYFTIYRYLPMGKALILFSKNDSYYISNAEYLPRELNNDLLEELSTECTSNNDIEYTCTKDYLSIHIDIKSNEYDDTYIDVPLLYYHGYTSDKYDIEKNENGTIRVFINNKKDSTTIKYKYTNIQIASIIISLITWITFLVFILKPKKS